MAEVGMVPAVVRWEEPPPSRHISRRREQCSEHTAVAEALRARPGTWAVIYEGPARFGSGLVTHIRTGTVTAYCPAGDFDACSRLRAGRRTVYARYLGDGEG